MDVIFFVIARQFIPFLKKKILFHFTYLFALLFVSFSFFIISILPPVAITIWIMSQKCIVRFTSRLNIILVNIEIFYCYYFRFVSLKYVAYEVNRSQRYLKSTNILPNCLVFNYLLFNIL